MTIHGLKPFAPRDLVARVGAAVCRRQTTIGAVGRQVDTALLEVLHTVRERELSEGAISGVEQLSSRQIEIVKRLLGGERVPAIARDLYLSQSTVRNHLSVIYQRLGDHSQEELLILLREKSSGLSTSGRTSETPIWPSSDVSSTLLRARQMRLMESVGGRCTSV